MKVSEVSLGQIVYVDCNEPSKGIVVKIKEPRLFCGKTCIYYFDIDAEKSFKADIEDVYPSLVDFYEEKLKKMEEEKNRYILDYVDKAREIVQNFINKHYICLKIKFSGITDYRLVTIKSYS